MLVRSRSRKRRGLLMVEASIVYSVALMLTLGTIVLGLGIFRNSQLASLARNGARWASVHGSTYQSEKSASAPTSTDVINAITPQMVCMNTSSLSCTLTMTNGVATVKLSYTWVPESYLPSMTLTSTAAMPITY